MFVWDLTNERIFDPQAPLVIDVLDLFFDMLSCTTRHWQKSGRVVQGLNIFTVYSDRFWYKRDDKFDYDLHTVFGKCTTR